MVSWVALVAALGRSAFSRRIEIIRGVAVFDANEATSPESEEMRGSYRQIAAPAISRNAS